MSNVHRQIYESLIKNYITNYDLEFLEPEVRNLSLSNTHLEFPFLYHKPYYIYNINIEGDGQFTALSNTYLDFLKNLARADNYNLISGFFDYIYYTTTEPSANSTYSDFVDDYISYNDLSDSDGALSSSNAVAQSIFNLRALQSYNLDDVNNHEDKVMTSRQIHLNDYASSYIRIPIAFITDNSKISIEKVIEEVFRKVDRNELQNKSISKIVDIIKRTDLKKEINKHFRFYFDIATLEYYFTPQLTMEDYTMNNNECYGVLAISAEDVLYTYLAHKVAKAVQNLSSSDIRLTFISKNIPKFYRVEFDAFIVIEKYNRQTDFSNNVFYRPHNKKEEKKLPYKRYLDDFLSYTNFTNGIKHTVKTTYKYRRQTQDVPKRLMEINSISTNNTLLHDTIANLYLVDRPYFAQSETGFYEGMLSEAYHRNIEEMQQVPDLSIVTDDTGLYFVKNNVNVDTIIFLDLYAVVTFCYNSIEMEKPEGDVKYTKIRFWNSVHAPPLKVPYKSKSRPPVSIPQITQINSDQIQTSLSV